MESENYPVPPENQTVAKPAAHNASDDSEWEIESVSLPATSPRDQVCNIDQDSAGPDQKERDADDQVERAMDETSHAAIVPGAGNGRAWKPPPSRGGRVACPRLGVRPSGNSECSKPSLTRRVGMSPALTRRVSEGPAAEIHLEFPDSLTQSREHGTRRNSLGSVAPFGGFYYWGIPETTGSHPWLAECRPFGALLSRALGPGWRNRAI